jgi:hypothetical protein
MSKLAQDSEGLGFFLFGFEQLVDWNQITHVEIKIEQPKAWRTLPCARNGPDTNSLPSSPSLNIYYTLLVKN